MSANSNGQAAQQQQQQPSHGPYRPTTWPMGGTPEIGVDVPITAVFLALFMIGAATHMTIFQLNKRRSHKFLFSGLLFGFCMARIVTSIMRIASTCLPTNLNLAIAAQIFVAAGVLLLFIINLLFTQRIIRAQHPTWGWHPAFSMALKALYVLIVFTLVMVITATVQSFFTLSTHTRRIDRDIQLYGQTYFAFVSFLPIPLLLTSIILSAIQKRRRESFSSSNDNNKKPDKFGTGRLRTKIFILLTSSVLLCLGASYRMGTSYRTPVPRATHPLPSYYHKAAFYLVNFGIEIIVVYMYAILRVDLRFHVPNGARGKGSYSGAAAGAVSNVEEGGEQKKERNASTEGEGRLARVYTEEETFDGVEERDDQEKPDVEDERNTLRLSKSLSPV